MRKEKTAREDLLRTGEQQRADGRYLYTYKDKSRKTVFIYSWELEPTDKIPQGENPVYL